MREDDSSRPPRRSLISPTRRKVVGSVGAGLASGLLFGRAEAAPAAGPLAVPAWTTQPGEPTDWHPYGVPSEFEKDVVRRFSQPPRMPGSAWTLTPLADLFGTITPSGLIYERHHAGIPQIAPEQHRLVIHGRVRRSLELTMDDLVRYPSVTRTHFLECSGNTASEWKGASGLPVQMTHGLLSCAEWTGVTLATLLDEVGVQEGKWLLAEGADAAAMTRSLPVDRILENAIVVYAQNGERLRPENGYPLRLLVPGFDR
ncbi:DMSO/TMAO reductase YedYZ molybdopterin-dependent catalytic subunit [Paraburkholderia sp. WSM4179]|nr:DMSO/TMAO reductase YedYZ molybdopterin-dependent catalytic subunit [Paraburkholderia sp. WSM4179]